MVISFCCFNSVISAVMYGAMAVGEANSFTPNYAKAKISASHILMLIDRVPDIDNDSEEGDRPVQGFFFFSLPHKHHMK